MITTKKIIGISNNSVGIVIDKSLRNLLKLNKGDFIEVSIKKIKG